MLRFSLKKNKSLSQDEKKIPSGKDSLDKIDDAGRLDSSFKLVTKIDYQNNSAYTGIKNDNTARGGVRFMLIEPELTEREKKIFEVLRKMLMIELTVDLKKIKTKEEAERRLKNKMVQIIRKYNIEISKRVLPKILYYTVRDFAHLGKIEPLMHDPMIEEISCDGTNIPLYIWHREYESMPTNIIFENAEELENFVRKLAYAAGKHVSTSDPILDAALPGGSRVNLTLGDEITKRGSTFTIRLFRKDPITIVDLVKSKTMSSDVAAYLWLLVEMKMTMLVAGGTASGKTTTLNAITSFIPPGLKVVTIEDTQELKLPQENWIPAVSRQSFTGGNLGEINQFDLLRSAMRQRPDIVIVGETRGKEAYVLFQAMATGHGGFSSIHADSINSTITRLTSTPMDVPKPLMTNTLDVILLQLKIKIGDKSVRRVIQISEIAGMDPVSNQVLLNDVFVWDPITDRHNFSGNSILFDKISNRFGISKEKINEELSKRKTILEWMTENDIHSYDEVNKNIMDFYEDPERFYERKRYLT